MCHYCSGQIIALVRRGGVQCYQLTSKCLIGSLKGWCHIKGSALTFVCGKVGHLAVALARSVLVRGSPCYWVHRWSPSVLPWLPHSWVHGASAEVGSSTPGYFMFLWQWMFSDRCQHLMVNSSYFVSIRTCPPTFFFPGPPLSLIHQFCGGR